MDWDGLRGKRCLVPRCAARHVIEVISLLRDAEGASPIDRAYSCHLRYSTLSRTQTSNG